MNEYLWAMTLQNTLDMMDVFNRARIVVHSTHKNIISFEMRSTATKAVSFGRIQLKSEYVDLQVQRGLSDSYNNLRKNDNIWHDNQIKRKQIK